MYFTIGTANGFLNHPTASSESVLLTGLSAAAKGSIYVEGNVCVMPENDNT